jgi:histidinol-phosphate aminotransferase
MTGPRAKKGIFDMPAYVGGRHSVDGVENPYKLSANENPLGASAQAQAALAQLGDLSIYPDGHASVLRDALAAQFGLDASRIVCGNGSGDLLHLLCEAYLEAGDEAIHTEHAFLLYALATRATGATPISVAEKNLTADVDALLAAVSEKTKIVFLANPNNPTGTMLSAEELTRLHAGLREDIMLVIDGAYAEYVAPDSYPADFDMVDRFPNVVATRTFSKAYGLAALRLGWGYAPAPIADALNRLRGPFNVNQPALLAGVAALGDQAHIETSRQHNAQWRSWMNQQLGRLGLPVYDSQANFVLLDFATPETAQAAEAALCAQGVIPRGLAAYGLPSMLRLTIGTEAGNRAAVAALEAFLNGQ